MDWSRYLYNIIDSQSAFSYFHKEITRLYNECFPIKRLKLGYKTKKTLATRKREKINYDKK